MSQVWAERITCPKKPGAWPVCSAGCTQLHDSSGRGVIAVQCLHPFMSPPSTSARREEHFHWTCSRQSDWRHCTCRHGRMIWHVDLPGRQHLRRRRRHPGSDQRGLAALKKEPYWRDMTGLRFDMSMNVCDVDESPDAFRAAELCIPCHFGHYYWIPRRHVPTSFSLATTCSLRMPRKGSWVKILRPESYWYQTRGQVVSLGRASGWGSCLRHFALQGSGESNPVVMVLTVVLTCVDLIGAACCNVGGFQLRWARVSHDYRKVGALSISGMWTRRQRWSTQSLWSLIAWTFRSLDST